MGNIFCTGTNYISSFDQKISLKVFSSYISVNTDVRVSVSGADVVVVQGEVIRKFLYRKEEEEKKKRERRDERRKEGEEEWREKEKPLFSISTGKNVKRTKQMNRGEEGMITTKMIIFNQNHDNNNK